MLVGRSALRATAAASTSAVNGSGPAMVFSAGPASETYSSPNMFGAPMSGTVNAGSSANISGGGAALPPMGKRRRSGPLHPQQSVSQSTVAGGPSDVDVETTDISITGPSVGGGGGNFSNARLSAVRNSTLNVRPSIPPPSLADSGKLAVILDVDETLIHSRLSSQQEQFRQAEERKQDVGAVDEFIITLEDGEVVRVNKRPGLDQFLLEASEKYELFAYTAGLEEYARPLLDWLDPHGTVFKHRLYRDSCLFMRGYYLKDLQKVNRPLCRTVLVDNNAFCFLPQLSNGVPISSFYDDPNDTALQVLLTFLERIRSEPDVRPFLRKSFNLEVLLKEHREQILN